MVTTGIQLYTLNDFDVSQGDRVRIAGETDVDGVEVVFDGRPSPATCEAFEETGLEALGVAAGLDDLEDRFGEVVAACDDLGSETVILGHLSASYFETAAQVRDTADRLDSYAARLKEEDLDFMHHTHRFEFRETGSRLNFDVLTEATSDTVEFEIDLGWAAVEDVDPISVLHDYGDRIRSVHLKDMNVSDETFVNLGRGDLDVEADARAAVEAGVERLIYEHEDPSDPVESVVNGASELQKVTADAGWERTQN